MHKSFRFGLIVLILLGTASLSLPRLLPAFLEFWEPAIIFRADPKQKIIYLTIDDATTEATNQILAVLAKHKVHATFFIISGRVKSESDLASIVDAGHSLGHHMRTTQRCSKLTMAEFVSYFDTTDKLIKRYYPATFFRPPSDFGTEQQLAYVKTKGYVPVMGTVFPLDHWLKPTWLLSAFIRWLSVPGGIVIMHDGHDRAARTAKVLDEIVPKLKSQGYEFAALTTSMEFPVTQSR